MRLASIGEHDLLRMWVQLLVILVVARGLGMAMRRLGQPPVVGELLAGVLLGPSVLAKLWPAAGRLIEPGSPSAAAPLNAIGWLGVAFLLVLTGFETDLRIVRRLGRPAAAVAVGGLLIPFLAGLGFGVTMPRVFAGQHGTRVAFVLFIAVSLSISSLPVIAKILEELGLIRRNFGQLTVAVGMVNDLAGWLALGLIAAIGRASHLSLLTVAVPIVAIAAILALSFTVGQRGVDYALAHLRRREGSGVDAMTVTIVVTLLFAALTQWARSDAVLGAYIAGILIGRSKHFQRRIRGQLESLTMAVFAPLFFATAGLRIDLGGLATPTAAIWAAAILLVAVATKLLGAFAGARAARLATRESLALAIGLNCRGAVEVVIATVGLSLGVLSPPAYTAIVLMAIVTSVMAPPLLRLVARNWPGDPEEQERLEREAALDRNLLIRAGRVLLPSRGGAGSVAAARLIGVAWPAEVGVTVLRLAGQDGQPGEVDEVVAALEGREVEQQEVAGDPVPAILAEAKLGYTAIAVGAQEAAPDGQLLSPMADELLVASPLPLVIVRRGRGEFEGLRRPQCALVPVAGSPASRTAQEVAYALARATGTEVVLTHVVSRPEPDYEAYPEEQQRQPARAAARVAAAEGIVEAAAAHAREHEVEALTTVRTGTATGEEILAAARAAHADLIVLGTTIRRLEDRSFLGHTVEHVIDHAQQPVVVVATPDILLAEGIAERGD